MNDHFYERQFGIHHCKISSIYQLYTCTAPYISTHCTFTAAAVCVSCQEVLTSTLREGNYSCEGKEIIFTCTSRGSLGLEWRSPEYIEDGNPLQFSTASVVGRDVPSMINGRITATARLTMNAIVNRVRVLESTLRIAADMASTVTCSGTTGGTESIDFFVSGIHVVVL
jgi:hypothetical protein